jgi:PRC-barrel domain
LNEEYPHVAQTFPASAQDKNKIDPATGGPTGTMTDQVPPMKSNSPAATGPEKSMTGATPSMKPGDPVSGASVTATGLTLSDDETKLWIGKPVYSSDGKNIGSVEAFKRGPDNKVMELHAGVGGFLGLGETHVVVLPTQFKLAGDRVTIDVASTAAKDLPKVQK